MVNDKEGEQRKTQDGGKQPRLKSHLYRRPYLTRAKSWKCTFICSQSTYEKGIFSRNVKGISRTRACTDTLIGYVLCIGRQQSYQTLENVYSNVERYFWVFFFFIDKRTSQTHTEVKRKKYTNLPVPIARLHQHFTYLGENSFW